MPERFSSCFGGCSAGRPLPSTEAGPNLTTSIYQTRLGVASLTWSPAVLGLSLGAEFRLSSAASGEEYEDEKPLRFRVRPWLLWKRRGSRRFRLRDHAHHRCVDFAWDLSRAIFHSVGGRGRPEPASGFFVAVAVDGEMLFVAGDLVEEAYKKTRVQRPKGPFSNPAPNSRREHVVLGDPGVRRSYRTMVRFGGRDREISIDLGAKEKEAEAGMLVSVDGERVLDVRRLQWMFRGTEKVEVERDAGARMQVSWDLHDWLFPFEGDAAASGGAATVPAAVERGRAMFMFRFEDDVDEDEVSKTAEEHIGKVFDGHCERHFGSGVQKRTVFRSLPAKTRNWSESSSNGGYGAEKTNRRRRRQSLLKTSSSSSSTSSVSSASSSTVTDWASQEEEELQNLDGFTLLVYIWKS
ncbi:hypothetical protein Cni_G04993 [Canna indica]|uniref:DUF868 family protein n=1 Tax=Canna indica TaxID=4628 RepID=A0AAQ3JUG2_9LILI|nr:hypothetical protein Cni_G04993 [Canna indica]